MESEGPEDGEDMNEEECVILCAVCHRPIRRGETVRFKVDDEGQKRFCHPGCYDGWKDEEEI